MEEKFPRFVSKRKLATTLGVVETIHTPANRNYKASYAWITTENKEETSIKISPGSFESLSPGDQVKLTRSRTDPTKYHILSIVRDSPHQIPVLGIAKWLSKSRHGWAVAITTRSQRVKRKPLLSLKLRSKPRFSQGHRISFLADFSEGWPCMVKADLKKLDSPNEGESRNVDGTTLSEALCKWLTSEMGANAILQTDLHGNFKYATKHTEDLKYLDREEKAIQTKHAPTDSDYQKLLSSGVREVRYIGPRDGYAVRNLKHDLVEIDKAGLKREIIILHPVHDLVGPTTLVHTTHTKLLDPKFLHIKTIRLLGNRTITETEGGITRISNPKLAAIVVASTQSFGHPLPKVIPCTGHESIARSQALLRKQHSKRAIKLLLHKTDKRNIVTPLGKVARIAPETHLLNRFYRPVVASFDSEGEAYKFYDAVANAEEPIFMAPVFEYYFKKKKVYNVTTASETSAVDLYDFFQAEWCYALSPTTYRLSTSLKWDKIISTMLEDAKTRERGHYISIANDAGDSFVLRGPVNVVTRPQPIEEKIVSVSGFPDYVGKATILEALQLVCPKEDIAYSQFTQNGDTLVLGLRPPSVLYEEAGTAGMAISTDLGPLFVARSAQAGDPNFVDKQTRSRSGMDTLMSLFIGKAASRREGRNNTFEHKDKGIPRVSDSDACGPSIPPQSEAINGSSLTQSATVSLLKSSQDSGDHQSPESDSNTKTDINAQRARLQTLIREKLSSETQYLLSAILDRLMEADEETRLMLIGSSEELGKEIATFVETLERERRNTQKPNRRSLYGSVLLELTEDTAHHAETITSELMKQDSESIRHLMQSSTHLAESVQRLITEIVSQSPMSTSSTHNREKKSDAEASSRHRSSPLPHSNWADLDEEKERDREESDLDEDNESSEEEEIVKEIEEQRSRTGDEDSEDDETSSPNKKRHKQISLVDKDASGRNRK